MNNKKLIIINRWNDEFSDYTRYIDHQIYNVAYLVNHAGSIKLKPHLNKAIKIVNDLTDLEKVLKAAEFLVNQLGGIDQIIAMSEFDLEIAAYLRQKFNIKGCHPEQVKRYRDKVIMKDCISQNKLNVPAYIDFSKNSDLNSLLKDFKFPLILKPKNGAASKGVQKISNKHALIQALSKVDIKMYECEQYIRGTIFHVDGLVKDNTILFHKTSKYINTCLDFLNGMPLGSVMIDDLTMDSRIIDFTESVLQALQLTSGAFHLELILSDSDDELFFLEIGARVGGGEIPFIMRDLFNINFFEAWMKIELGEDVSSIHSFDHRQMGGFLMIPEPKNTPCKVIECKSMISSVNCLYKEIIPSRGYIFKGKSDYEDISGRFLFKGSSTHEIEESIKKAIKKFSIVTESITDSTV